MKKIISIVCVIVFAFAMTACGSSGNQGNEQKDEQLIGADKAIEIALAEVDGATAKDVTRSAEDIDDGITKYDVEIIYDGYEYDFEIDGTTGRILEQESEVSKKNEQKEEKLIGVKKAVKIALAEVDGATENDVVKSKEDFDDGVKKYEVGIVYNEFEYDFEIDGKTGKILEQESESIYDD